MEIPKKKDLMDIEHPKNGSPTASSSPNPQADKIRELIFRYTVINVIN
jgi:hypothetical protein